MILFFLFFYYCLFILKELQSDTTGYNQALLQNLTSDQQRQIQNIIDYAGKRKQEKGNIKNSLNYNDLLFFFVLFDRIKQNT